MQPCQDLILGIDEAGRGPVIGPLVLCGVWVRARHQRRLQALGVRDSKAFGSTLKGQARRAELAAAIHELAVNVTLLCVDATEVDRRTRLGELNLLEQELAGAIIDAGPPARRIISDGARLFGPLTKRYPQLEALDRADDRSPVVAAASIVAKSERDRLFQRIAARFCDEFGPLAGGGYANRATASFLRAYCERHQRLPGEVRLSWNWGVLQDLKRQLEGGRPYRRPEQLPLPCPLATAATKPPRCVQQPESERAERAEGLTGSLLSVSRADRERSG